ncbi:unnamed protein product [Heligmosomoides polygyrus]|uniref:Uncharacterized protein n=1 Tax=Heligmosomoides polygyrus TaxID=6339 RepID=A0A183GF38_HELPZ|nr:unnamed protein product [Heligmosomoides polygyrus]
MMSRTVEELRLEQMEFCFKETIDAKRVHFSAESKRDGVLESGCFEWGAWMRAEYWVLGMKLRKWCRRAERCVSVGQKQAAKCFRDAEQRVQNFPLVIGPWTMKLCMFDDCSTRCLDVSVEFCSELFGSMLSSP